MSHFQCVEEHVMRKNSTSGSHRPLSRREFIKTSAAVSLAALTPAAGRIFAAGSDTIRIGLVGCGGRGTGAAIDCLTSSEGVEIVAMGDLFQDRLENSLKILKERLPEDKVKVSGKTSHVGFDAFKSVIGSDINLVLLATPPHFRPEHLRAALEADKHVFMEKPVTVDPAGVRSVMESADLAKKRNLAIVAGTQRRHQAHYLQIMKRIHDGAIGEIVAAQCYWNQENLWIERATNNWISREEHGWSDMEWQCRNWLFVDWLSGDHIVEQHVHNLDVINWALNSHPVQVMGMGGREVRTGPEYGNIYDHFAVEYEYPNGVKVLSMCRQMDGCSVRVSERVVGTEGSTYTDSSNGYIEGVNSYRPDKPSPNPYVQEHADLIAGIRKGQLPSEGKTVAESTLTAIMGRMSAYTGRELKWDWVLKESKLNLTPPEYRFGDLPLNPVPVPGKTQLI